MLSRGGHERVKRTPRPADDESPQRKRPSLRIVLTPPRVTTTDLCEADSPETSHASNWPSPDEMRSVRACPSPSDTRTTSPVSRALHARRRCGQCSHQHAAGRHIRASHHTRLEPHLPFRWELRAALSRAQMHRGLAESRC